MEKKGTIDVDGSQKSGSGTILRLSVALAAITGQPLHIFNIRQNRPQHGLKHQHLEAVLTVARLCGASVQGASLGSQELWFTPQKVVGGSVEAEIETAGSIPMLLLASLPVCLYADQPVHLHVAHGGTDTTHAPTINYMRCVLLPTLRKMGVTAEISVTKYGYYPKGGGEANMTVQPNHSLKSIRLESFGKIKEVKGISICTSLADRQVADRQRKAAQNHLAQAGFRSRIDVVNDQSNSYQKGSSIVLWAETDSGVVVGADAIGQLGKMAEEVGKEAAEKLLAELVTQATTDMFLADMLIPYMALAGGKSAMLCRKITEHVESNIWLIEKMLNITFRVQKVSNLYRIETS